MNKQPQTLAELDAESFSNNSFSELLNGYGFFTTGSFGEDTYSANEEDIEEEKVETPEEDTSSKIKEVTRETNSPITVVTLEKVHDDDMPFEMDDVDLDYNSLTKDQKQEADKFISQYGIKLIASTANFSV